MNNKHRELREDDYLKVDVDVDKLVSDVKTRVQIYYDKILKYGVNIHDIINIDDYIDVRIDCNHKLQLARLNRIMELYNEEFISDSDKRIENINDVYYELELLCEAVKITDVQPN